MYIGLYKTPNIALCCLVLSCIPQRSDKHSGSIRFNRDRRQLRSLVARRRHAKKVGNFHFLCLVQVTRIYIAVEETLLGFVLASRRIPRCKEEEAL